MIAREEARRATRNVCRRGGVVAQCSVLLGQGGTNTCSDRHSSTNTLLDCESLLFPMSTVTLPSLDCRFFPHLWDSILASLDPPDLLNLRFVCHALKFVVDKTLCGNELGLREEERFCNLAGSDPVILPFFSPGSHEARDMQLYAVRRAWHLEIDVPTAPPVNNMLRAAMDANADVTAFHCRSTPSNTVTQHTPAALRIEPLPPCDRLWLHCEIPCPCERPRQSSCRPCELRPDVCLCAAPQARLHGHERPVEAWSHSAKAVHLSLIVRDEVPWWLRPRCLILASLLSPTVRLLHLELHGTYSVIEEEFDSVIFPSDHRTELDVSAVQVVVHVYTDHVDSESRDPEGMLRRVLVHFGFHSSLIKIAILPS